MMKKIFYMLICLSVVLFSSTSFAGVKSKKSGRTTTVQTTKASSVANSTPAKIGSGAVYKTDTDAAKGATDLGYTRTNLRSSGDTAIFKKGNSYITRDRTGHKGGAWKEASSPENLNKKSTRNGTFDVNMNRIGD